MSKNKKVEKKSQKLATSMTTHTIRPAGKRDT